MFTLRDRRTGELFDRWSDFGDKRRRLMEQSWAGVFRNHLLVELPVDDLCRHLDERMGRPSKDLHVVIGVLLLQQLHDLSDAETVEALAFNMAWHYALDVRSEADSYFCEKTLRNYRRLFIEQGLDELLFRCLTDRLVQGFSVDTSHQRMDSTALRSATGARRRYLTDMLCSSYPDAEPGYPVCWVNYALPPGDWNREPWGSRIDIAT